MSTFSWQTSLLLSLGLFLIACVATVLYSIRRTWRRDQHYLRKFEVGRDCRRDVYQEWMK